jgi:lysozyme family protein
MAYPEIFKKCMPIIFRNEGGYVWNINDPGGETNFGIARKFYPNEDIKNMTKQRATYLYYRDYWTPMNLKGLKDEELILQVFDFGINAGIRWSIRLLQRLVEVDDDGIVGPITTKKVNEYGPELLDKFKKRRLMFYMNLAAKKPQLEVFLRGWLRRVNNTKF